MNPNLPPLLQSDWWGDFEGREWAKRMDDHFQRRMRAWDAGFDTNRSEMIGRAIWGRRAEGAAPMS